MTKDDLRIRKDVQFFPGDLVLVRGNTIAKVEIVFIADGEYLLSGLMGRYKEKDLQKIEG
jgi:hypothetical protein